MSVVASILDEYKRYKALAEAAISQIGDADLKQLGPAGGNSIEILIRHLAGNHVGFPFIEQRPADGTGAEVGHVLILRQPIDCFLDDAIVAAEHRAVAGQEIFGIVLQDPFERSDEVGEVGAVVSVDDADAAILVNVVAAEEKVPHLERKLPGRVPRRVAGSIDRRDAGRDLFERKGRRARPRERQAARA